MASIVWMAVFILLMVELGIVALLVLPLPNFVRRFIAKKIFTYDLAKRVRFTSNFIILGLMLAVSDAVNTLRNLEIKEESHVEGGNAYGDARVGYIDASFDKQRKFRAERNMYLAGFALTLVFVIARLVELMQQVVNKEEEKEVLTKRLEDLDNAASKVAASQVTDISSDPTQSAPLRRRSNTTDKTD